MPINFCYHHCIVCKDNYSHQNSMYQNSMYQNLLILKNPQPEQPLLVVLLLPRRIK